MLPLQPCILSTGRYKVTHSLGICRIILSQTLCFISRLHGLNVREEGEYSWDGGCRVRMKGPLYDRYLLRECNRK